MPWRHRPPERLMIGRTGTGSRCVFPALISGDLEAVCAQSSLHSGRAAASGFQPSLFPQPEDTLLQV